MLLGASESVTGVVCCGHLWTGCAVDLCFVDLVIGILSSEKVPLCQMCFVDLVIGMLSSAIKVPLPAICSQRKGAAVGRYCGYRMALLALCCVRLVVNAPSMCRFCG